MDALHIVVTEPEYIKAKAFFDQLRDLSVVVTAPAEKALAAGIRDHEAQAAILGVECYTRGLYAALPRGGVISRFGVGYDGIDLEKATAAGLLVTNTPGVLEDAVAEHALALMLGLYRNLARFVLDMAAGAWSPRPGLELRGRTLAVIGCGTIGRRVARIARQGFGMHVVAMDTRSLDADELHRVWGIESLTASFDEAVQAADVISLHVPSNAATRHLVCARTLSAMPASAVLVNTSRGAVVDENALFDALAAGRLGGAALDVFEVEPYAPRDPERDLRTLPNVLLTPHVSSGTVEACARVAAASVDNVRSGLAADYAALSLLNPEVLSVSRG